MRTTNLILSSLILLSGHVATAKADPACATCAAYDQVAVRLRNNAPDALDDALLKIAPLATGRVKTLSPAEADAVLRLMLPMLKADQAGNGGDVAAQLYNVWRRHATVMDQAVAKLGEDDRSYLQTERRLGQTLMTRGND